MARAARQLELTGVFASAITPRRADSQDPDFSGMLDLLDFLAAGGVKAVCMLGDTGEFFNYSFAERQRLVYLGVKRSRVPLLAGVSHSTLAGALQLADEAIAAGADGLIVMPPYFFHYSQREIEEFYVQFARETGDAVPILIHNLPQATSKLEIDLMRRLVTRDGESVSVTRTEWLLLQHLAANAGKVMLNTELLTKVWGPEYRDDLQYLRVWISRLRGKLEETPSNPRIIKTLQGIGYLFEATPDAAPEVAQASS